MDRKEEINAMIVKDKEFLFSLSLDMIAIYIKLLLFFPKQTKERKRFIKQILFLKKGILEEIYFLRDLFNRKNLEYEEEIDVILNSLDLAFEQDYYDYDALMAYMESSIEKRELHFYNDIVKEGILLQKIKRYQQELALKK